MSKLTETVKKLKAKAKVFKTKAIAICKPVLYKIDTRVIYPMTGFAIEALSFTAKLLSKGAVTAIKARSALEKQYPDVVELDMMQKCLHC